MTTTHPAHDDFDDLEALLSESMAQAREAKRVKDLRQTISLHPEQNTEDNRALLFRWDSRHVWRTVAETAVFIRAQCSCGGCSDIFSHWMVHQEHREVPTRKRYTKVTRELMEETCSCSGDVPSSCIIQIRRVNLCTECAGQHGFDLSQPAQIILE